MQFRPRATLVYVVLFVFVCLVITICLYDPRESIRMLSSSLPSKDVTLNFSDDVIINPIVYISSGPNYHYLEGERVSLISEGETDRDLTSDESHWVNNAKEKAVHHLSSFFKYTFRSEDFLHGRYRWLPSGTEFDLMFRSPEREEGDVRVVLHQPLGPPKVLRVARVKPSLTINLMITIKGVTPRFGQFLDHLVTHVLPHDNQVILTVLNLEPAVVKEATKVLKKKLDDLSGLKWRLISMEKKTFMTRKFLERIDSSKDMGEVVFLSEEEVFLHPDFFRRCRGNVAKGRQVYFPVSFALYNPKLTYTIMGTEVPPLSEQLVIDHHLGYWRHGRVSSVCLLREDLKKISSVSNVKSSAPGEGLLSPLFKKAQINNMKVIRAPDPSLFHVYQEENCSAFLGEDFPDCLSKKAVGLGPQEMLGLALLKIYDKIDIEDILFLHRRGYPWLVVVLSVTVVILLGCNITQMLILHSNAKERAKARIAKHQQQLQQQQTQQDSQPQNNIYDTSTNRDATKVK